MVKNKRRTKEKQTKETLVLVDGYYIPEIIKQPYEQLKQYCIDEVSSELEKVCHRVDVLKEDDYLFVAGWDLDNQLIYKIELSPVKISQIEKAIGTKKLSEYIKEQKDG